ncbi:unnamed protein product [Macrosiphum euphorbiae]|uniref:Uncharacterized protein n=1 Tax=Macrosiphum euphorbiae TaxID=13131 RepID=A0AAV0XI98_9HEMI|nr:unnamed protein product [Macrosiphum euphorbiae]
MVTRFDDKPLWWTVHRTDVAIRDGTHRKETPGTTTARFQNLPCQCTNAVHAHGHCPRTGQASYFYLHCAREIRRRPPGKGFSVPWRSSAAAAADSTVISGGGCSVATALCWAAGVYGREWFPYGTTESDRD